MFIALNSNIMKVLLSILLLLSIIHGSIIAGNQEPEALDKISVLGNSFVNSEGDTLVFQGLNTSDPDHLVGQGHWNRAYFEEMKNWGANVVRFPVHPRAWRKWGESQYLFLLDQGVNWATEFGMYVIIDWHSIGNLRTQLFQSPGYETTPKETYEFWRTIASRYKDNTTVAFYELYNEPTEYHGQLGTCTWEQWKTYMEEIIGYNPCKRRHRVFRWWLGSIGLMT